jgi:diacylglycerol O-acyltransferase / wax synthase
MGNRRQLGVQDALWLEMDRPNNLMVVDSVIWTAEPVDWDRVRVVVNGRLSEQYPVFRSRAVRDEDGTWWWEEDEAFNFDDHVTIVQLDDPGDPRSLQHLVASHRTEMLDRSKPLWQAIWVDRYLTGSAMIMRTHHAIADGMRMVELAMRLFDATPEGGPIVPPEVVQHAARPLEPGQGLADRMRAGVERAGRQAAEVAREASSQVSETMADPIGRTTEVVGDLVGGAASVARRVPETVSGAAGIARGAVTNPVGAGHTVVTSAWAGVSQVAESVQSGLRSALPGGGLLVDLFSAAPGDVDTARKLLLGTRNDTTMWTGTAGNEKGVAWSEHLPLHEVKAVARANQATVNDVLVTCVAATLHDYLEAHHARCSSVTFMVPVNPKSLDPSSPDDLGNGLALVQLELPTDQPDPREVLKVAKRRMDRIKHGHEAAVAFRVQETIAGLSRGIYEASVDLLANRTVGVLTNVPGPPIPVYIAGSKVEGIVGWAPLSGDQPMSFTIYSYNGNVIVGIACDTGLVPDHERIVDGFGAAFERLRKESLGR